MTVADNAFPHNILIFREKLGLIPCPTRAVAVGTTLASLAIAYNSPPAAGFTGRDKPRQRGT